MEHDPAYQDPRFGSHCKYGDDCEFQELDHTHVSNLPWWWHEGYETDPGDGALDSLLADFVDGGTA